MSDLNPKHKLFVAEYLKDLNATQAATRCGYSGKTARQQGARLLSNAAINAAVQKAMEKRSDRVELSADWVIKKLMRIADSDLAKAYAADGSLLPVPEMPEEIRKCLAGVDVHKDFTEGVEVGETKKIKVLDQTRALELLGRHLKLFTDRVEHTGKLTWEEHVMESLKEEK